MGGIGKKSKEWIDEMHITELTLRLANVELLILNKKKLGCSANDKDLRSTSHKRSYMRQILAKKVMLRNDEPLTFSKVQQLLKKFNYDNLECKH